MKGIAIIHESLRRYLLVASVALFAVSFVQADARNTTGGPELLPDGTRRFVARGDFRGNVAAARDSALVAAQIQIRSWLVQQDPPIRHVPSLDTIRREMLRHTDQPEEETVLGDREYKVTAIVELRPYHVHSLRSRDRTVSGLWLLGGGLAILGVVAIFLRIDEWTKGFLTRWLVAVGIAIIGALIATIFSLQW